jgi:hypothetical protein
MHRVAEDTSLVVLLQRPDGTWTPISEPAWNPNAGYKIEEPTKPAHIHQSEMIATFEASAKLAAAYPMTITFPNLNTGELYVGSIISADGKKREHIILLPGEIEDSKWSDAMEWAKSIGGTLPDRCESALLFAILKDQFKEEWYWTCEQNANGSDYAWIQYFGYGTQYDYRKSYEYRARAVRRIYIESLL